MIYFSHSFWMTLYIWVVRLPDSLHNLGWWGNLTNISSDVLTSLAWNLLIAGRPKKWRKRTRRIKCNRRRLRKNSLQVILFQHLNVKWIEAVDLINKCKIWGCSLWTSVYRQKCTSQDYNSDSMFLVEDQIFWKIFNSDLEGLLY